MRTLAVLALLIAFPVALGVFGAWLHIKAEPVALWLTRRKLERQGFSPEEAERMVTEAWNRRPQ